MLRRLFFAFIIVSAFTLMGCKITGKITQNGVGLEGITVVLSGDVSMSTTTDADGAYVFRKLKNGNYKVKPANSKFTFEPVSRDVTINYKKKIARADFETVASPPLLLPPWSTYQGNAAHTGYVSVELNPDNFSFGWDRELIKSVPLNPVSTGLGQVFVTTGGDDQPQVAMALDSADGSTLWTYDFGDIFSVHPPAYANGTVYIQSAVGTDSFLWAFRAEPDVDGSAVVLFKKPYDNRSFRFYAPTIYDGQVYVGGGEPEGGFGWGVYGFDGTNGNKLWYVQLNPYEQWTPAVNEEHVIAYTGLFDPQLTVIHRLDGETWKAGDVDFFISDPKFEFGPFIMDLAPVLGSQNNVIVIQGGRLINFDLEKRAIGWEILEEEGDEEGFSGQPSLAEGIIFAIYEGELRALDESDGSFIEEWKPWQPPADERIDAPMIVTDNLIFVSTGSKTYAVDLEKQKEQWSYPFGGQLALSDEGVLFIATADGILIAINTD